VRQIGSNADLHGASRPNEGARRADEGQVLANMPIEVHFNQPGSQARLLITAISPQGEMA
jgi:hypothetical protein